MEAGNYGLKIHAVNGLTAEEEEYVTIQIQNALSKTTNLYAKLLLWNMLQSNGVHNE